MDSSFYYYSLYDLAWYSVPFIIFIYTLNSSWLKRAIGDKQTSRLNKIKTPLIVVLVCCAIYSFYKDDELNPEIVELLEEYSTSVSKNDNGSVYHLGMWSSLDSSPHEVGLWRIKQYENSLINSELPSTSIEYEDYPESDWIEEIFPESDKPKWLCDYDEIDCLDFIYTHSKDAIYLGKEFSKHISRYDGVLNYSNFGLYQEPSIYSPMMMFGPGIDVLKIKLILNLHAFKLGNKKVVIKSLTKLLNHHKSVLGQTPYTVSKVISVVELQLIYKASAFLISQTNDEDLSVWKPYIDSLVQLEKNQLTFDKPLNHEFISSYKSFQIAGLGDYKKNLPTVIRYLPKSVLYKPNRTANLMFKGMTVKRGKYELLDDRIIVHDKPNVDDAIKFDLSNPIGSLLAITVTPKYLELDGALHNLEIFQRLTKYLYSKRLNNVGGGFVSPYTGNEGEVVGHQYCIDLEKTKDKPMCLSTI